MKASSQEKEKRNIYLAVAGRLMIKCKIKLALARKKKKEHKDAQKKLGIHDSSRHYYLVRNLPKQKCGLFIINVFS